MEWFCNQLSDLDVTLYYAVLHAEPDTIISRLRQRGDAQYIDRLLFLRNKLMESPTNEPFLMNTDRKRPEELAEAILKDARFRLRRLH